MISRNIEDEVWKDIPKYEDDYMISSLGRVYSKITNKILKTFLSNGYLKVTLYKDGRQKHFFVHRLLALTFIPNPTNLPHINHKDENKQNNSINNLEWCSAYYNNNYGTRSSKAIKNTKKPIIQLTIDGAFIREWDSARDAERELGISYGKICSVCKGNRKTTHNFKWRYKV